MINRVKLILEMNEVENITWRELSGNKFSRMLSPAMLTEEGYIKQAAIRKTGSRNRAFFNIKYNRDYLIEAIGNYICKPLFVIGKEKVLELVGEAWDNYYPSQDVELFNPKGVPNGNHTKV